MLVCVCAGGGRAGIDDGRGREPSHKPSRKVNEGGKIPVGREKRRPSNPHTLNEDARSLQRGQTRSEELISL